MDRAPQPASHRHETKTARLSCRTRTRRGSLIAVGIVGSRAATFHKPASDASCFTPYPQENLSTRQPNPRLRSKVRTTTSLMNAGLETSPEP
eukprot:scaffold59441_cov45-Phaeocystis_antarctica.AAC.2